MRVFVPLLVGPALLGGAMLAAPGAAGGTLPGLGPIPPVPAAPPPPALIPPPDDAPPHPTGKPPLPAVNPDAPGSARALPHGVRISFGPGGAELNPATDAAVLALAPAARDPDAVFSVEAHAPGTQEDRSTPRRLALERGLAVRSALINAGVASTRIYVRALGEEAATPGVPEDRVDIVVSTIGAAARPATAASAAAPANGTTP